MKNSNKNEKSVAVLLAAYNGEKYIADQIDSILNQTYRNLRIYVLDDCSTDKTVDVLEKYVTENKIVLFKNVDNLGYPESFYWLMKKVDDADYYAFSDQDDIWEAGKIERAVELLDRGNTKRPLLAFARYNICDENLSFLYSPKGPKVPAYFRYSLFSSLGLGFTYVLNRTAKNFILKQRSQGVVTKDVWIGMLCSAFGQAFYDPIPSANHRRYAAVLSATNTSFLETQKERYLRFFKNDGFTYVREVMREFYDRFGNKLKHKDKELMEFFLSDRKRLFNRFKKVVYPHRLRYDIKDEIMLRIVFALGRL